MGAAWNRLGRRLLWLQGASGLYARCIVSSSSTQHHIIRHSGWTLLQQLGATFVALGTSIMLARLLGPSGQGLYGVIATTAMLGSLCINLGVPAATTYAVSCGQVSPRRALSYTLALTLFLGGLGALLVGALVLCCAETLWPAVPKFLLLWACALIPALLATQLIAGILQGAHAFARYNIMALVAPSVSLVTSGAALSLGGGVGWALGCGLLGQLCAAAWGAHSVSRLDVQAASSSLPASTDVASRVCWWVYFRSLLTFGAMAALANALAYLSYRMDVFLLNVWLPKDRVGYYSVAASVAERLWMLSGAVSMVLFAQVARSHAQGASPQPDNPTPMLVRHVLWLVTLAAILLYAAAPKALPLLFGPSYVEAAAPLRALLPGVVVFNVARLVSQDLAGRGLVRINVIVGVLCLGLNVLGNLMFIPHYGAVGAAWASTLSYSADTLLKLLIYTRLTKTPWLKLFWPQAEYVRRLCVWTQVR